MRTSDLIGFMACGLLGVWWLLLPRTVIRFYEWFSRGRASMGKPGQVRIAGLFWLALLLVVFWASRNRWGAR